MEIYYESNKGKKLSFYNRRGDTLNTSRWIIVEFMEFWGNCRDRPCVKI